VTYFVLGEERAHHTKRSTASRCQVEKVNRTRRNETGPARGQEEKQETAVGDA